MKLDFERNHSTHWSRIRDSNGVFSQQQAMLCKYLDFVRRDELEIWDVARTTWKLEVSEQDEPSFESYGWDLKQSKLLKLKSYIIFKANPKTHSKDS